MKYLFLSVLTYWNLTSVVAQTPAKVPLPAKRTIPARPNKAPNKKLTIISGGAALRPNPDETGKAIIVINRGAQVEFLGTLHGKHEMKLIDSFVIKGNWAKVKYGNKEGYIFDQLISDIKLPKPQEKITDYFKGEKLAKLDTTAIVVKNVPQTTFMVTIDNTSKKFSRAEIYFIFRAITAETGKQVVGDYDEAKKELMFQKGSRKECFLKAKFEGSTIIISETCR